MEDYPQERTVMVAYILPTTRQEPVVIQVSNTYEVRIVVNKEFLRIHPRDNRTRQP
jgi:hypothetical protein